jgi:hypothetical protein
MLSAYSDRSIGAGLVIAGVAMLVGSLSLPGRLVLGPLGVEAGFTVVLLAYLYARHDYGFRRALVAMAPAAGAQITILLRHDATFAWLGAELALLGGLELAWLAAQYLLAPPSAGSPSSAAAPRLHARAPTPAPASCGLPVHATS